MNILKEETSEGTLKQLTFRRGSENMEAFKVAVKSWIEDNFQGWDEKEIYQHMTALDMNKMILDMA